MMDCQKEQKNAKMDFCVKVVGIFWKKERISLCETEEQFKTVTMEELKKKIIQSLSSSSRDWPRYLELLFENKKLEDSTLLHENGIRHESIIYMARVYGQKKSVMKKADEESEAPTSADEEERCKQEEMETIQVLICVSFDPPEKVMAVLCNTKEEMQKMTVELMKNKIYTYVTIGDYNVYVDEVYFNGKHLEENSSLLSDHGVQHMSTVEVKVTLCKVEVCSLSLNDEKTDEKRFSLQYFGDFEEICGPVKD